MRAPLTAGLCLAMLVFAAAPAGASSVLVFDGDRARERHDPAIPEATELPPTGKRTAPGSRRAGIAGARGPSVRAELARLLGEGQIDQAMHDANVATYKRGLRAYRRLSGTRRTEMRAALKNVETVAAGGQLTPSRLAPLFLTVQRNMEYWDDGPLIANGRRIVFSGTKLIWQYYRGQGLAIQPLANWGTANGYWSRGREGSLKALLDELVPLAADRGGVPAWEYYFAFGGGTPPWSSGLSQGTAVQALGRSADLLGDPAYRDLATRALGLFEQPPPNGVRVQTPAGAHYLIYTFAPDLRVLNAFLQALIGLHDFAELSGDQRARDLYNAGDAEARADVPRYDTGAWSLYSLERESDLGYHRLVRDFLQRLCDRTAASVYCDTAGRFTSYEDVQPAIAPLTRRVRGGKPAELKFRLSKISRVGLTVLGPGGETVFVTSATVGYGDRFFTWSKPAEPGSYTLRLSATDLAGNRTQAEGPLRVLKPARKRDEEPRKRR